MAATAGVRVTGITISKEQLAEGRKRVQEAGLEHLVDLIFCDYRQVQGTFDKVVSIEMIEAVGHEHLHTFFAAVSRALKPGGLAAIQVGSGAGARRARVNMQRRPLSGCEYCGKIAVCLSWGWEGP
jgi:cyclopropane-fatty-acyl-phospholipid synthase